MNETDVIIKEEGEFIQVSFQTDRAMLAMKNDDVLPTLVSGTDPPKAVFAVEAQLHIETWCESNGLDYNAM